MITVLYVDQDSDYYKYPVDCYSKKRNALNYKGTNSIIAHPPCRLWSRMRTFSTAPPEERLLAHHAIKLIHKNGGILEHPAASTLFPKYLPLPGTTDKFNGFTICIDQNWFGHPCRKKTLLYIKGINPSQLPPIPYSLDRIEYTVSSSKKKTAKKEVSKKWRSKTPQLLIEYLIETANIISANRTTTPQHYQS